MVTWIWATAPSSKWPRTDCTSNQSRPRVVCAARAIPLRMAASTVSGEEPTISTTRYVWVLMGSAYQKRTASALKSADYLTCSAKSAGEPLRLDPPRMGRCECEAGAAHAGEEPHDQRADGEALN